MRLLILLSFASGAWCGSVPLEQLTIWIYDYAPVPPQTLDKALLNSQEIFLRAGIEMKWLKCRPFLEYPCVPPLQSTDVLVRIMFETTNSRMQSSGAFGCILLERGMGLWINVFYGPVEHKARKADFPPAVLLGMVITHELGYFFGLQHHRLQGIMLSVFGSREMRQASSGALIFDKIQAQYLRTAIATRLRQLEMAK
jgi:hypothetical protein